MSLSSRVDISGRRRSVARRMRRGALPSSLIGLVTFSFTVLAFSSVAYTTSLPALVQAAQRADDDSLFYKALAGLAQAQGEGSAPNDAAQDGGNAALGDAGQAAISDASGAKPPLGGVSLGGSMLQGVISNIAGVTQPKPDEPGSNGGSEQGGANPDGPAGGGSDGNGSGGGSDTGSGGNGGGNGGSGSGGSGSGGTGSENKPDLPTPEEEQAAYDFLLNKVRLLDSYVSRVNARRPALSTTTAWAPPRSAVPATASARRFGRTSTSSSTTSSITRPSTTSPNIGRRMATLSPCTACCAITSACCARRGKST